MSRNRKLSRIKKKLDREKEPLDRRNKYGIPDPTAYEAIKRADRATRSA